jgi:hypothetical protein
METSFALLCALILAAVGGLFVYLALGGGALSVTQFGTPLQYITVAFIAFVNAALCAAAVFTERHHT